jgi:subtilisin-like proprotein convertase family protein
VPIPDDSEVGGSVPIAVSMAGYASKLTFSIDGATCSTVEGAATVGIDHTFVGDLVGTLTAPDGKIATLFARAGGSGNNLCQVVFDDAAAKPFATVPSTGAPFTGTWRPADPLAALLAAPVTGTWTFKAVDSARLDTGTIRAVSLHITGFQT